MTDTGARRLVGERRPLRAIGIWTKALGPMRHRLLMFQAPGLGGRLYARASFQSPWHWVSATFAKFTMNKFGRSSNSANQCSGTPSHFGRRMVRILAERYLFMDTRPLSTGTRCN